MERLGATDDEVQLRSVLALCAIADGRLADAEAELAADRRGRRRRGLRRRRPSAGSARAELALARGDDAAGLRAYRECVGGDARAALPGHDARPVSSPGCVFGESTALTAHALYAAGADEARRRGALRLLPASGRCALLDPADPQLDIPVVGVALFGLGAWGLLRDAADAPTMRSGCSRWPTGSPTTARSRRWPGSGSPPPPSSAPRRELPTSCWRATATRRPRDLLDEARAARRAARRRSCI